MAVHCVTEGRAAQAASRRQRLIGAAAATATLLTYVTVRDPHRPGTLMLRCPTKLVTGLDCPGCGGLRLAHDLTHGNLADAVHDNVFLLMFGPVIAAALVDQRIHGAWSRRRGPQHWIPHGLAAAALTWMMVRNLPRWPLKPTIVG